MAVARDFVKTIGWSCAMAKLFADALCFVACCLILAANLISLVDLLLQSNGAGIM
jgi:hypothetical protein